MSCRILTVSDTLVLLDNLLQKENITIKEKEAIRMAIKALEEKKILKDFSIEEEVRGKNGTMDSKILYRKLSG